MFKPDKRKEGNGSKREGRMFQILTILYDQREWHKLSDPDEIWLTSTQIAHQMGLDPSWYVRDMLQEMHANNWITGTVEEKKNGAVAYIWSIAVGVEKSERWRDAFSAWYETMQEELPGLIGVDGK